MSFSIIAAGGSATPTLTIPRLERAEAGGLNGRRSGEDVRELRPRYEVAGDADVNIRRHGSAVRRDRRTASTERAHHTATSDLRSRTCGTEAIRERQRRNPATSTLRGPSPGGMHRAPQLYHRVDSRLRISRNSSQHFSHCFQSPVYELAATWRDPQSTRLTVPPSVTKWISASPS